MKYALVTILFCMSAAFSQSFVDDQKLIDSVGRKKSPTSQPTTQPTSQPAVHKVQVDHAYKPGKPIVDIPPYREQGIYDKAIKEGERRALINAEQALLIPPNIEQTVVSYPPDWPEKMKKREQYKGGVIWRGPSEIGPDGKERYIAVYEVGDLIYVPPDFGKPNQTYVNPQLDFWGYYRSFGYTYDNGGSFSFNSNRQRGIYSQERLDDLIKLIQTVSPDAQIVVTVPEAKSEKQSDK